MPTKKRKKSPNSADREEKLVTEEVPKKQKVNKEAKPQSLLNELKARLPEKLDSGFQKAAAKLPQDWKLEFKSPLMIVTVNTPEKFEISKKEAEVVVDLADAGTLHKGLVSLGGCQFLITTVTTDTFYGKGIDSQTQLGVVISVSSGILVGVYGAPLLGPEFVPKLMQFGDEIARHGF
mmetsp:Transcript_22676/g.44894  ORF Transcript_22676/g.44894 Transcript_22676/m.44894 type:complete len:178 (+) Transcript_22676:26-559(+)